MSLCDPLRFRDRLITDGLVEVGTVYEDDDPKREGAIEGFEICRSLSTREEFEAVLRARASREEKMRHEFYEIPPDERDEAARLASYWRHRWGTLQIEFVFERMKIAADWLREGDMISARAALKVTELLQETQP